MQLRTKQTQTPVLQELFFQRRQTDGRTRSDICVWWKVLCGEGKGLGLVMGCNFQQSGQERPH